MAASDGVRLACKVRRIVAAAFVAIVSLCVAGCGTTRGAESKLGDRPEMTVGNIHGFFRVKSADEIVDPVPAAPP